MKGQYRGIRKWIIDDNLKIQVAIEDGEETEDDQDG